MMETMSSEAHQSLHPVVVSNLNVDAPCFVANSQTSYHATKSDINDRLWSIANKLSDASNGTSI
jgi:hypothetical protein